VFYYPSRLVFLPNVTSSSSFIFVIFNSHRERKKQDYVSYQEDKCAGVGVKITIHFTLSFQMVNIYRRGTLKMPSSSASPSPTGFGHLNRLETPQRT